MPRLYQGSFSAGELAPGLWGRVDLDRFGSGARVIRNAFPKPEGGIDKRPGLEFIGYSIESLTAQTRLIPFKFNNEQTYMLVVQPNTISFIKNGGFVLEDYTPVGTLTLDWHPTNGWYFQDTSGAFLTSHPAGTILFISTAGSFELTQRWVRVKSSPAPTNTIIYIEDFVSGLDITSWSTLTGAADTFGKPYILETADGWFTDVDVSELDFTQANDTLYIAHPDGATKVITRGATDISWTIAPFDPAPAVATPTTLAEGARGAPGSVYTNTSGFTHAPGSTPVEYAITAIDDDTYEESLADLFEVTLLDPTIFTGPPDTGTGCRIEWTWQSGADNYRVYKAIGGIYGLIGNVKGTSGTLGFDDIGYTANLAIAPPLEVNPTFDSSNNYPGAVELFQQRIMLGRTNTELIDIYASRSGSFSSFSTTTVSTDDDPIEMKIAARSVNEVRYFVPLRDMVIMTSDGEWGFDYGDQGVLTPSSGLIAHSYWGSSRVKPTIVGDAAIFVEKSGRSIRDLAFSLASDGFASTELSLMAKHLFRNREVVSICFAQNPYQVLFCVMADGQAVSCTYVRDQQVFAWARHDTRGTMLDCSTITEDGIDNIYVVVERESPAVGAYSDSSVRHIERMRMQEPTFLDEGVYLDNSVEYRKVNTGAAFGAYDGTVEKARVTTISGVTQLELGLETATASDGDQIQFQAADGSALNVVNNLVFTIEDTGNASDTGRNWFRLQRTVNGDITKLEYFDWARVLPEGFNETGVVGYYIVEGVVFHFAHHLPYRGATVSARWDNTMYSEQTIPEGGIVELSGSPSAAKMQLGETYITELETLDIDSIQDPVTGVPLQISKILARFTLCWGYKIGRTRDELVVRTSLEDEDDFDIQLNGFQGIIEQAIFPGWRRNGRVVIRSEDGFPWLLSAVIPVVDVGDMDE